jgi:hypothetical protein
MYIMFVGTWLIVVLVALSSFCISLLTPRLICLGDTGGAQNPSHSNHNSRSLLRCYRRQPTTQLMQLWRRAAAGLSPVLYRSPGRRRDPLVVVVGAGVVNGAGPPGRASTSRMAIWSLDLEFGVLPLPDLVGGGRRGIFGGLGC